MSAPRRTVAGLALLLLAAVLAFQRPADPTPEVRLPPIYVPNPLPANCGRVFGDVFCWTEPPPPNYRSAE